MWDRAPMSRQQQSRSRSGFEASELNYCRGRASQAIGRGFESRLPLHSFKKPGHIWPGFFVPSLRRRVTPSPDCMMRIKATASELGAIAGNECASQRNVTKFDTNVPNEDSG